MRSNLSTAVATLLFSSLSYGQGPRHEVAISIDESKIRAHLERDSTVISIPIANFASQPVKAELALAWLRTDAHATEAPVQTITIPPGQSTIDTPLALESPSIWTRLRYSLTPVRQEARAFPPAFGILSLPHISDYAFELRASYVGVPRRGHPLVVHAEAVHPVTRAPIPGIEWTATLSSGKLEDVPPRTTLLHKEGFTDFTFDLPADGKEVSIEIAGKRGDFEQDVSLTVSLPAQLSGRIQTDKPIYQPGQTLHFRAVISDAQGRAASGAKATLRIEDDHNERTHTINLVASKFGIVQDDWIIPASASLGTYRLTLAPDPDYYQIAQHIIRLSRYELPTFNVTVKPNRATYLPDQPARVTITGAYLFGKPVPKGHVKIVRTEGGHWNQKTRQTESSDEVVAEGEAGADGTFTAQIHLEKDHEDLDSKRFEDVHFAAYYTDPTSRRVEQRKFDLRITREPIHVYLIPTDGSTVYVTTSHADGRPTPAEVAINFQGKTTTFRTNRYGVGKATIPYDSDANDSEALIKATDDAGQSGQWEENYWFPRNMALFRLDSTRTIHRAGQAVTLKITSPPQALADQFVLINAVAGDRRVATRIARLTNHYGELTFPYQPEFRRGVVFVAWNAAMAESDFESHVLGSRAVIFPDRSDLVLSAVPGRSTYKPGDRASLNVQVSTQDGKSVEAALGLAIVDQAVLERARTDGEFGRRPWFACAFCNDENEAEIGGVRLNDLYALKPDAPITPDLDLVAEALVSRATAFIASDSSESVTSHPFPFLDAQMVPFDADLRNHYAESLEFPEDEATLSRILGLKWSNSRDPWDRPYRAEFGVKGKVRTITILSSGPDKQVGTADDFEVRTFTRPYFTAIQRLIERILSKNHEYPPTSTGFERLLSDNGLLLGSLRDPWETPYQSRVETVGANRLIKIISAGPDRTFNSNDDVSVATFTGLYFRRESGAITRAVGGAAKPPQSVDEFRQLLDRAGIDVASYRDAWGRPYRLTSLISSRYADRVVSSTVQVFGAEAHPKTEITPVTQKFITFELRSNGPDGVEDTYDDFAIANFPVVLSERSAAVQATQPALVAGTILPGTGTISGNVTDQSGGTIPNATITLQDAAQKSYEASSAEDGSFRFTSVPTGTYSLKVNSAGFSQYYLSLIPVTAGKTTNVEIALQVGTTAETVTVEAQAMNLQMVSAEVSATQSAPAGTPRVREYFPETLLWLPELLTDSAGRALTQFTVADSVTTWKIAAFASTLDGRTAEAESDFRSFQPLFLDFSPPPVLTEGDEIELPVTVRNYQSKAERLTVSLQPNDWSVVKSAPSQPLTIAANRSENLAFRMQATRAVDKATQRVTAGNRDAIERSIRVHPDGQQTTQTFGDFVAGMASFTVSIPKTALPAGTRGELRVYPNIASLLLESAAAILFAPHGCAEQTISAGYSNLIAWRFSRAQGIPEPKIALTNVRLAVEALSGFRNPDGGVRYWNAGDANVAATAYALSFLVEASTLISIDMVVPLRMASWLEQHQSKDGTWGEQTSGSKNNLLLTATVVRALALAQKAGIKVSATVLAAAYHHIAQFTDRTDEPYMLANFILAVADSGDEALLGNAVARLTAMAREERGGLYWDMRTNSPFYGWGTAGRYETTGLVISALTRVRRQTGAVELDGVIRRGLVFLLRGRNATGYWYSTQSTLRAMSAIADASSALGHVGGVGGSLEVRANGRLVKTIAISSDTKSTDPVILDLAAFLSPGDNQITVLPVGGMQSAMLHLTATHWQPWDKATVRSSPELRLAVQFDRSQSNAGEPVRCTVKAERIGFRGYGMMLAEIGLPPGAEVDRASLEAALVESSVGLDHYEILPDRVVLYLWPKAGGAAFDFFLSTRMAMSAKSAASVLYDYNNPEALAEVQPSRWLVK